MKARILTGFWAVVTLALQLAFVVQCDEENLRCQSLKDVFPTCPCRAAPADVGSVFSIVDCSGQSLSEVPLMNVTYDREIYKFILRNNNIVTLTNNSFQGLKIKHLDLSDNPLASVESGTFVSMKDELRTLEIDGNSANRPPNDALQVLTKLSTLVMRKYSAPALEQTIMSFLPFTYLKILTLDSWDTQFIETDVLLNLASLKSLNLLSLKLVNLPVDLLAEHPLLNLENLRISSNKIKTVTHSAFHKLAGLKYLDLSDNEINELEDSCFKGLEDTLVGLNLKGNHLFEKNSGLVGLTHLKNLDLSKNTFTQIPPMPNLGTTKSLTLLLNGNQINEVQTNAFGGYAQYLTKLDLTENYIRTMNSDAFEGVTQLTSIHLNNQLGGDDSAFVLPSSLKNSFSTLNEMDLSGQKVDTNSMWDVIKTLTSIEKLNLNSIELTTIPDLMFENANSLRELDLGYNSLSLINQNSFMGLRNLEMVNLQANELQTMPSCLFYGFQSAKIVVHLSDNPIKCNCNLKKFVEDVKSLRIELDAESTCDDSLPIASIDPNNLGCSSDHQEESCIEYPITVEPVTGHCIDQTSPNLSLNIGKVTANSLSATWTITSKAHLESYTLTVKRTSDEKSLYTGEKSSSDKTQEISSLPENTNVVVCVTAVFTDCFQRISACQTETTKRHSNSTSPGPSAEPKTSESSNTGIIVGCVVAGVALIGVLTAIIILLVLRKRPKEIKENSNPAQPRHFSKAELPSMTEDSRTFKKPQKRVSSPEPKGMQVVAISDGQTSPGARVGRANMMFQDDNGYEPMKNFKKMNDSNGSAYENDRGSLPPTPGTPGRDSIPPAYPGGYYNQGFRDSKYDSIEVEL